MEGWQNRAFQGTNRTRPRGFKEGWAHQVTILSKKSKKELEAETLQQLDHFIEQWKAGKVELFKEKLDRAREALKKAGLIK
ncbi:hypothetical protein [Chryseolinea serpens]|uniref:hypothetical protein n=1 Tax=Chryseolinea serpens TaxID=947013 RepID=UPI001160E58D|nr:hypothetical protein [Chryseolinea serpens]